MKYLIFLLFIYLPNLAAIAQQAYPSTLSNRLITQPYSISLFRFLNYQGEPLIGAEILIGQAPGKPFPGNVLVTDQNGRIHIPAAWNSPLSLTITATDHIITTYLDVFPASITDLTVQKIRLPIGYSVKGDTTGFGRLRRDGLVDFAIVMDGMSRTDLLHFDMHSILSSELDTIYVAGKPIQIPSNLTLPKQRENFPIPVTFNKPSYHLQVSEKGPHNFIAIHGRFPVKEVARALRDGESIFDVMNYFEFLGGGAKIVSVERNINIEDISVNKFSFLQKIVVTAPKIAINNKVVSIALTDFSGTLLPSDMKLLTSEETKSLTVTADKNNKYILSALFPEFPDSKTPPNAKTYNETFNQISLNLEKAGGKNPNFLSLVPRPIFIGNQLHITPPTKPQSVEEMGTIFMLSSVEEVPLGKYKTEYSQSLWKLYVPHWVDHMVLPEIALNLDPNKKYRWEAIFLGGAATAKSKFKGVIDIEKVTHISRSYLDL